MPRNAIVRLALAMLLLFFKPVSAQAPDQVIRQAETALQDIFTPCSSKKFLECITLENKDSSLDGTMTRTINGGLDARGGYGQMVCA